MMGDGVFFVLPRPGEYLLHDKQSVDTLQSFFTSSPVEPHRYLVNDLLGGVGSCCVSRH